QQTFGTATNTYTMPGITSAASTAAQSGPIGIVTSDSSGNLATVSPASLGLASSGQIDAINAELASHQMQITENRRGIAAAMAMTTAAMPSAPGRTTWAINAAAFLGEMAT